MNHRAKLNQAGSSTLDQQSFAQYELIGSSDARHLGAALVNSSAHGGKMLFSEGRRCQINGIQIGLRKGSE